MQNNMATLQNFYLASCLMAVTSNYWSQTRELIIEISHEPAYKLCTKAFCIIRHQQLGVACFPFLLDVPGIYYPLVSV
jgi:hypothetical protein